MNLTIRIKPTIAPAMWEALTHNDPEVVGDLDGDEPHDPHLLEEIRAAAHQVNSATTTQAVTMSVAAWQDVLSEVEHQCIAAGEQASDYAPGDPERRQCQRAAKMLAEVVEQIENTQ